MSFPPEELRQIVHDVAAILKERNETISVAETVLPHPPIFQIPIVVAC